MKRRCCKKLLRTVLVLVMCCALCPASLLAQWDKPYPESWKDDDLEIVGDYCVVNRTKHLTWYPSGYIYGIIENTFDYNPDTPTKTPWIADEEGTAEDYEGNIYKTLRFGDTWWMAENLRTKTFSDDTQIQKYVEWNGSCDGGIDEGNDSEFMYTHANNDPARDSIYGCLYNWNVGYSTLYKKKKLLKEDGWVIPDTLDFYNLMKRFGVWSSVKIEEVLQNYEYIRTVTEAPNMGLFMKSDRNTLWATGSPRAQAIPYNASGLSFPPAGQMEGTHSGFGTMATIWTGTAVHETPVEGLGRRYFVLGNTNNTMTSITEGYGMARSVRLVKRVKRTKNTDGTYTATNEVAYCPGYPEQKSGTITSIAQDLAQQGIKVWGTQGSIKVEGCTPGMQINIYNMNGTQVKTTPASYSMQIPMNMGLYIVRINGISKKVVVE